MNGQIAKKVRREVRRVSRRDFRAFIDEAAAMRLITRLQLAWNIAFRIPHDPRERSAWLNKTYGWINGESDANTRLITPRLRRRRAPGKLER